MIRGRQHGRVYFVVYSFHSLLAGGAAGACALSFCLANYVAVSDRRNCGARSFWAAGGDVVASGKVTAWAPDDLKLRRGTILLNGPHLHPAKCWVSEKPSARLIGVSKTLAASVRDCWG